MDRPGEQCFSLFADGSFMQRVEISSVIVQEVMLNKLHLPYPEYENQVAGEDSFTAKVMVYPSMPFLRTSPHPYSMYSYLMPTLEAATRCAARQALEYMEKVEKKMPSAFTDVDLEKEKKTVKRLHHRLEKKNEKLTANSNQMIQTVVASDAYIENVTESTRRIKKIILKSLAPDRAIARDMHRASLLEIQAIATDLSHHTAKELDMIKAAGPPPYSKGAMDDDRSDGAHWKFDCYEFDSDGHPIDYEV